MKSWRIAKGFGLVIICLFGSLSFPATGWALKCLEPLPAEKAFEDADYVFKGTVKERKGDRYIIQVDTVYKGEIKARAVVKDMIGYWLQETLKEGGTYLIYGHKEGSRIEVSPCGRTDDWAQLKTDVENFSNRERIEYDTNDFLESSRNRDLKIASTIAGLLLFTTWILWRRKQRNN